MEKYSQRRGPGVGAENKWCRGERSRGGETNRKVKDYRKGMGVMKKVGVGREREETGKSRDKEKGTPRDRTHWREARGRQGLKRLDPKGRPAPNRRKPARDGHTPRRKGGPKTNGQAEGRPGRGSTVTKGKAGGSRAGEQDQQEGAPLPSPSEA